jgi:hypothetical protein
MRSSLERRRRRRGRLAAGLAAAWLLAATSAEARFAATCVGAPGAKHAAIFLRGITPAGGEALDALTLARFRAWPTTLASEGVYTPVAYYEAPLAAVAARLDLRFALVTSDVACRGALHARCFFGDTPANVAATYAEVVSAARRCFEPRSERFGLVGFSNGGYHVARSLLLCLEPHPRWALAIGGAGDAKLAAGERLDRCARAVTLAAGDQDGVTPAARALAAAMRRLGLAATFQSFPGGHELTENALATLLAPLVTR